MLRFTSAFDIGAQVKSAAQGGLQTLAVDIPTHVFESLARNSSWLTDDDAWRSIAAGFPTGQSAYAQQIRDDARQRRSDGHQFLLLIAVREERVALLTLVN
jgi:eukaryotic translation initiation factor 2-alpha kinase 4